MTQQQERVKGWTLVLVLCLLLLGGNFLVRLIDQAAMMQTFPFDYANDINSYIAQLHFLDACGYHGFCPYWYEGFVHLATNPPGWVFFAYPLLRFLGDPTDATYVSLVVLTLLGLLGSFWLASRERWNRLEGLAFFFFVFGNALAVGTFLRLGRLPAYMSMVFFVFFLGQLLAYLRSRRLSSLVYSALLFSVLIVTHYQEAVLGGLFYVGLLLAVPTWIDRWKVIGAGILSLLLSSWWWIGFLRELSSSSVLAIEEGKRLLDFSAAPLTTLLTFLLPLVFLSYYTFLWRRHLSSRKHLHLFLPLAVVAVLMITRVLAFVPFFQNISAGAYFLFFILSSVYLLFLTFPQRYPSLLKRSLPFLLVLASIASVTVSVVHTPWYQRELPLVNQQVLSLFNDVEGKYYLVRSPHAPDALYTKPYYSYGPVYHNLTTAGGWYTTLASPSHLALLKDVSRSFKEGDCPTFVSALRAVHVTDVISDAKGCQQLDACGLTLVRGLSEACLYRFS